MRKSTPDQEFSARQKRHLEACLIANRAVEASDDSRPVVAAKMEVTVTELSRVTDPMSGRMFPLEHALALDERAYRRFVGDLAARAGLAVVDLPKPSAVSDELRALATAQRETSQAIAHGLEAWADGHMCCAEGVRVEQECDEAIAALLVIRERARVAKREGVVGLRAVVGGAS